MDRKLADDCFRPEQVRMRHAEALARLRDLARPVVSTETLEIALATGRVLAEPVVAEQPVPLHTNSAVDGYAFAASSYERASGTALEIDGRAAAGHPLDRPVPPGKAARVLTGAVMPPGTDTVVMQEDAQLLAPPSPLQDGRAIVRVPAGLKPGANVRRAGEDVAAGALVFAAGRLLRPQDVAALASVGRSTIRVASRLSVGVFSTGDELVRPGGLRLREGQVFDANAPMLCALAHGSGAVARDLGILPDDAAVVREQLAQAARRHHVVLLSGGASLGEEDHVSAALAALGSRHFWQIAIKPGRPMMLGQIGDAVVIGLPGNPVAVFVCYLMYVHPLLRSLAGAPWREPRRFRLPAAFEFRGRKTGRREFWRGLLIDGPEGVAVDKFARDGSGLISGLSAADGLIDIPEEHGDVARGDLVPFIPFSELGLVV